MAKQLSKLGVDIIEAGFPIASEGDFEVGVALARGVQVLVGVRVRSWRRSCKIDGRVSSVVIPRDSRFYGGWRDEGT